MPPFTSFLNDHNDSKSSEKSFNIIFSFLVALLLTQACAGKHFLVETKDKTNPDQDYEATLDGQEFRAADHKLESEGHGGSDYRQATEPPPKSNLLTSLLSLFAFY